MSQYQPTKEGETPPPTGAVEILLEKGHCSALMDVLFITNGNTPRWGPCESVSYNETDLIRELQTMCSSKSEPNISKIASPRRTSSSSLALQMDNRPAAGPTMKQPLNHR